MSEDRCASRRGRLRCAKRVHEIDRHVGFDPDGARDAATEWWDRTPAPAPRVESAPEPAPTPRHRPTAARSTTPQYATGEICDVCGSLNVVRTGTCSTCQDCGSTTSCG